MFFLLGIKVFIDLKMSCQLCFWISIFVHRWTNNLKKNWIQWERAFALLIWRIDDFMGIQKLAFCYDFEQKKIIRGETIYLPNRKNTCHPEGTNFLTYTFHTFFSGNKSLLLTLKFGFQSCFGSRFSSINLILWKKRPLCKFVYSFPNISFSGDKYIWKLSVFQAKSYDKPIWREVARYFNSLPFYIHEY